MTLTVDSVQMQPGSTIATGIGTAEDGTQYRFAGDWRPMQYLAEALETGDSPEVELEGWQIIGRL